MRLKRYGRKNQPIYRIIIIPNTSKRDGKAIKEVGFYNPNTKKVKLEIKPTKNVLGGADASVGINVNPPPPPAP